MTTEPQTNLKFLVGLGKSPLEALCMFEQVYKELTLSHSTVSLWHKRFKEGCEDVEDDPRCGRPSTSRNETNVELVKKIVHGDRRSTVRLISDELGLNRSSIWQIITDDLGMCKDDSTPGIILNILTSFNASFVPERNCWMRQSLLFVD